ncbi:MAG: glycerophosphodiester phosphodiesterase [Prevotella sp.]|nr:glycerophosphodiester phosphodiesterase [Prevotella sp.]
MKKIYRVGLMGMALLTAFTSCSDEQQFTNEKNDAKRVDVQVLNAELAKVRDYVPLYAVVAHRGSTFWTPEETESAWRWAREMGADYLESDLQCTKDGVVLANHDENLKRTTNIENIFSESVPTTRVKFYQSLGFSYDDAFAQYQRDIAAFRPFYTLSYYYAELLMLDAGSWFNESSQEQARASFEAQNDGYFDNAANKIVFSDGQYVSALQDQIAYASGKRLKRDAQNRRVLNYNIKPEYQGMTLEQIWTAIKEKGEYNAKYMDFIEYHFDDTAYEADPQDTGNRPGIYIEFKESWLNPGNMEQRVYDVLDQQGWNIMTKPASETAFYKSGKVNVGNTNGKVILQTFSFDALRRAYDVFKGKVPMCYLLWTSDPAYATDIAYTTPTGYAAFIKWAQDYGSHIIGPAISGAPNNYPEMNCPWQAYMIRKSGMLNHPYSFDSYAQMTKYMGYYNYGWDTEFDDLLRLNVPKTQYTTFAGETSSNPVYMDGFFTNRTEMSLLYMIENGFRCNAKLPNPFHPGQTYDNSQAPSTVPDAVETLQRLGYNRQ